MKYKEVKETFKDPVCGMEVSKSTAPATSEYRGKTYYFCAELCRDKFEKEPDKYVSKWLPPGL
jgi:YHS domain-containing protein